MKVFVFASGSSGNCLLISSGDTNILIDAGISLRRLSAALAQTGHTMRDIGGVLITHEHSDHISGLKSLIKKGEFPICAPRTVASRLRGMLPEIEERLRVVPVGESFQLGDLSVRAFHTSHDTDESVGYRVEGEGVFALATDTGCVTEEIEAGLRGAGTVLIEANHDEEMLRYGPYPVYLKRRILSEHGHLSNAACAQLARRLADSGTRRIILGHLSRENNRPEKALKAVSSALEGCGAELCCAPVLGCLELPVEEAKLCLLSN